MLEICIPLILVIAVHGASVQTANKEVAEDQPVVLACSFDGFSNNELEVRWVFQDPAEDETIQIYKFGPGGQSDLILNPSLGWTDAGSHSIRLNVAKRFNSGKYTCIVEDGNEQFAMGDSQLTVLVPPSKPVITSPSDHKLLIGQAGELVCKSAEGAPEPKYEWFKLALNGSPMKLPFDARNDQKNYPNSTFTLTADGTVNFLNVVENDQGEYYCTATNTAGTVSGDATMISIGSVSVASVVGIVFGVIFGVALLGVLGYILVTKLAGGDAGSNYADSEVFEDGQADVMIGDNYPMPTGVKSTLTNRQEQSVVV